MSSFWQSFKKPIFLLAPMDEVTDTVFRQVINLCSRPDIFMTEFVNCDGLCSRGYDKLITKLKFSNKEKPIIAQIWGSNPETFYKTAKMIVEMGFDGIDINMGCPDKSVLKSGGGAALIGQFDLAKAIIEYTRKGANNLPVSVKTRIGIKEIQTEKWVEFLLNQNLDALTIHARTAKEMSKVSAHWEEIGKAVEIKKSLGADTLIIGNGDVKSYKEGLDKCKVYGVDGIMIGRGVFENPWIFNSKIDPEYVTVEERLKLLLLHTKLFNKTYGKEKNFNILKKFFKIYASGFPGASELRVKLMETKSCEDVEKLLAEFSEIG